jgi:hypothetical protein
MDDEELTAGEEWAAAHWEYSEQRVRTNWGCLVVIIVVTILVVAFLYLLGAPDAAMSAM